MANSLDVWVVLLDEIMGHVQKFVDDNPVGYKGKEKKAYTTGLGMVSVLCKAMMEDIIGEKDG
jgi:signal transduction histidine kinase